MVVTYGATGLAGRTWGWVFASATTSGDAALDGASICHRQEAGESRSGFVSTGHSEQAPIGLGGAFTNTGGVTLGETLGVWLEIPPG